MVVIGRWVLESELTSAWKPDRQTDRQTDRQAGRQADRQTDRDRKRQRETDRDRQKQTGPDRDRQAGKQARHVCTPSRFAGGGGAGWTGPRHQEILSTDPRIPYYRQILKQQKNGNRSTTRLRSS